MIKTENSRRIVTAVLLAGVTVAGIMLLESLLFAIAVGLIAAVAAWEWCHLGQVTVTLGWNIAFILLVGVGSSSAVDFSTCLAMDSWRCLVLVDKYCGSHRPW